jgi:hypothetical protein
VSPQSSAHEGHNEAGWPPGEHWTNEPADGDRQEDEDWPGGQGPRPPGRDSRRRGARLRNIPGLALVAVLAGGAGVGLAWPFLGSANGPATAGSGANSPSYQAPGGAAPGGSGSGLAPGGSGGGLAPGQAGGNGVVTRMFLIGQVTAVSRTSITLAGNGPSITAAVTSQTKITGTVHSITEIHAGDQVSAQIMRSGGKTTATAIQYPPQQPAGRS